MEDDLEILAEPLPAPPSVVETRPARVLVYAKARYGLMIGQETIEVPPGLGYLDAHRWALVSVQPRGAQLVREVQDWAAIPPRQAQAWLERTRDVDVLGDLLAVEQRANVRGPIVSALARLGIRPPQRRRPVLVRR